MVITYKCDGCGDEVEQKHTGLPRDWWSVEYENEEWHACSRNCRDKLQDKGIGRGPLPF